ncbi:hypothetical protein JB92DRAFT_2839036 [Gautieria morchelliformis]|nr:hypothetical protein JB92DRAFT_2839036 [Gautieria morchelliformis]
MWFFLCLPKHLHFSWGHALLCPTFAVYKHQQVVRIFILEMSRGGSLGSTQHAEVFAVQMNHQWEWLGPWSVWNLTCDETLSVLVLVQRRSDKHHSMGCSASPQPPDTTEMCLQWIFSMANLLMCFLTPIDKYSMSLLIVSVESKGTAHQRFMLFMIATNALSTAWVVSFC